MATLVLRTVKGTPLTNTEVDGNFANLNSDIGFVFTRANTINSSVGVLSNLATTEKSNLVAAINEVASESTSNVAITAGTVSGVVISNSTWSGNTIAIAQGGTGQTTRAAAINALLPSQTSNTNYFLRTDGSDLTWAQAAITITDDTTTNSTFYIPLTTASTGTITTANVSTTKLFFNPSTGLLSSTDYNSTSDILLKENITSIENPLETISKLNGIKFNWKDSGSEAFGLSAQEVEKIIPEIVRTNPSGYKGINYLNIIAFLVEAIKDLKSQVQELKNNK